MAANAGALGLDGLGGIVEALRQQIRRCKALTNKPFMRQYYADGTQAAAMAQVVIDEGVPVVTTGGAPGGYIPAVKAAGIKVFPVVPAAQAGKAPPCWALTA